MANETIGSIRCEGCGSTGELRRCRTGQRLFYWVCECGKITPNLPTGQKGIYDRAVFDDPEDKKQLEKYLIRKGVISEQAEEKPRVEEEVKPVEEIKPANPAQVSTGGGFLEAFLGAGNG